MFFSISLTSELWEYDSDKEMKFQFLTRIEKNVKEIFQWTLKWAFFLIIVFFLINTYWKSLWANLLPPHLPHHLLLIHSFIALGCLKGDQLKYSIKFNSNFLVPISKLFETSCLKSG